MYREASKILRIANSLGLQDIGTIKNDELAIEHADKYDYRLDDARYFQGDCPYCQSKGGLLVGGVDDKILLHCNGNACSRGEIKSVIFARLRNPSQYEGWLNDDFMNCSYNCMDNWSNLDLE